MSLFEMQRYTGFQQPFNILVLVFDLHGNFIP